MKKAFTRFADATSRWCGSPTAFILSVSVVVIWAFTGPIFRYSDLWQLAINTGTTIVTFWMVFLNPEPRWRRHSSQARRADPRRGRRA